ncbi:MAG: hypothetical protein K0R73_1177 [Candidatus Midichloriaceae bacterium]|jgi:Ser/Thr protein kinase RdoA (MazF antagonist)|nr:hypothetical protein [Candidatus Midichloriaceae bacterium]
MLNELIKVLPDEYGFKNIRFIGQAGGMSSTNYFIEADSKQLLLKIYKFKDIGIIEIIEEITEFLRLNNIPVVKLSATKNKKFHLKINDKYICIYPKIEGCLLQGETLDKEALFSFASLISDIHSLAPYCKIPLYNTKDTIKSFDKIYTEAQRVKALIKESSMGEAVDRIAYNFINLKLNILRSKLKQFEYVLPCNDLVHGDCHPGNILFDKHKKIAAVLDFETMHFGHAVEDVIQYIFFACYDKEDKPSNLLRAKLFLKFYQVKRILTAEEIKFGLKYYLYKMVCSFFLENKLYLEKDPSIVKSIEWEMGKIKYMSQNYKNIFKNLCAAL